MLFPAVEWARTLISDVVVHSSSKKIEWMSSAVLCFETFFVVVATTSQHPSKGQSKVTKCHILVVVAYNHKSRRGNFWPLVNCGQKNKESEAEWPNYLGWRSCP